jgi:hypothetical protein
MCHRGTFGRRESSNNVLMASGIETCKPTLVGRRSCRPRPRQGTSDSQTQTQHLNCTTSPRTWISQALALRGRCIAPSMCYSFAFCGRTACMYRENHVKIITYCLHVMRRMPHALSAVLKRTLPSDVFSRAKSNATRGRDNTNIACLPYCRGSYGEAVPRACIVSVSQPYQMELHLLPADPPSTFSRSEFGHEPARVGEGCTVLERRRNATASSEDRRLRIEDMRFDARSPEIVSLSSSLTSCVALGSKAAASGLSVKLV